MTQTADKGLLRQITDLTQQIATLEAVTSRCLLQATECHQLDQEDDGDDGREGSVRRRTVLRCRPVGYIRTAYRSKTGAPRQGTVCPQLRAELRISRGVFTNPSHSLEGLDGFSHVWLVFWFHLNSDDSTPKAKVHPPRLQGQATGVFSTRSPHRPNPIGLTLARLERVVDDTLILAGVDLVDGTPVLDVKPYIRAYDAPTTCVADPSGERSNDETSISPWLADVDGSPLLHGVVYTPHVQNELKRFHSKCRSDMCPRCLEFIDEHALLPAIDELLRSDLRSVYRKTKCSDRIQFLYVDNVKLSVWYDSRGSAHVLEVASRHDRDDRERELETKPVSEHIA